MSHPSTRRQLAAYVLIVAATSALVFLIGAQGGSFTAVLGANVPLSAIAFVCPTIGALIVAAASETLGQLKHGLRFPRRAILWWVIAITAMPLVVLAGAAIQGSNTLPSGVTGNLAMAAILYVVSATGEQIGWMGFVLPRLHPRLGEIRSGLLIGAAWAGLHIIPYTQAGHSWAWIAGQCVFTICFAGFLTQVTIQVGGSIWPAVLAHASYNTAWTVVAGDGGNYSPWVTAAFTALLTTALHLMRCRPFSAP